MEYDMIILFVLGCFIMALSLWLAPYITPMAVIILFVCGITVNALGLYRLWYGHAMWGNL